MTIKQALKFKNKLVQELNDLTVRLQSNNSVLEGNLRNYSSKETLASIYKKIEEINVIKTQIHRANVPVYDKIFLMGELKSLVKNLKQLDCTNGVAVDYYSRRSESSIIKNAEISVVERDNEVKFLEARIEQLQEELDQHNFTTTISGL
jgi:hypothetical protein